MLEASYSKKVSIAHRKRFAQFFTPEKVAEVMVEWVIKGRTLNEVLEPAFGLGIFSRLILNQGFNIKVKGFDIDPIIIEEARQLFDKYPNVSILKEDFLFNDWESQYDGVLCNPPYFKFHNYENKKALNEIQERLNIKLNGFTNIYTLFLLKSIYQLREGGRAAFIIPSEFLNSDYGVLVKETLLQSNTLKHIIVFDFTEKVFADALTTSSILFMEKSGIREGINFTKVRDMNQLKEVKTNLSKDHDFFTEKIDAEEIDPRVKWRVYYQKKSSDKYKSLIAFNSIAKVVRGIATGANDYFTFNESKALTYRVPSEYLMPCITKSKDVQSPFFTECHFKQLAQNDSFVYLFNANKPPKNQDVLNYIKLGEEKGIDNKFLTSKRKPWYSSEKRLPSPIWVSVFNRNHIKFIRNEAGISNLTAFHCIYLKPNLFGEIDIDILFSYLLTDIAKEIFNDNKREYGDGLNKFEPNDLNNGLILDLSKLSGKEADTVKSLYSEYRNSIIENKQNDFSYIHEIENILKKKYEA